MSSPRAPGVEITSIMTVGDSVNLKPDGVTPYRAVGIMDGLGAYDNGDGTFTLVMNHEIPVAVAGGVATPVGGVRAHGNAGAFVSMWTIDKDTLEVLKVEDLLQNNTSIFLSNNDPGTGTVHTGYLAGGTTAMARLCSADLAAPTAYAWTDPATGIFYGTTARIFQTGEESGGIATSISGGGNLGLEGTVHFGRQWNMILTDDPNIPGDQSRTAYEMPHCGLFAWENNLANPLSQRMTITAGMDDGSPIGQLYFWVGEKQTTGNVVERAGLTRQSTNDNLWVVKVPSLTTVDGSGVPMEDRTDPGQRRKGLRPFQLLKSGINGDVSGLTFAQLEADSDSKGATQFLRPEDGQWDPNNPSDYYFVTTDRYDQVKDGVGTQVGRSRLYRLRFTDIAHPELGGTIECLLDGTEAGQHVRQHDHRPARPHPAPGGRRQPAAQQQDLDVRHRHRRAACSSPSTTRPGSATSGCRRPPRSTRTRSRPGSSTCPHILGPGHVPARRPGPLQPRRPGAGRGRAAAADRHQRRPATLAGGVLTVEGTIDDDLIHSSGKATPSR